jgi:hypothetical protein
VAFRFTYAFHAREVRFERDAGDGFVRVFPETFSFQPGRHDPAELYLQLDDLARKPRLLSPRARRRDAEVLLARLVLGIPRYLERVLDRLESEGRLSARAMEQVYEEVALLAQILARFVADRGEEEGPGIRVAAMHLRKLAFRSLLALTLRRVEPDYLAAWTAGEVDPVDPADDLSEAGFFHTLESGDTAAVNRSLVRLAQRAFHRWLEDVCLVEENRAFEVEDSPFADRETEVLRAIAVQGRGAAAQRGEAERSAGPRAGEAAASGARSEPPASEGSSGRAAQRGEAERSAGPRRAGGATSGVSRAADLSPFLRRRGDRDCLRVLGKLEAWFLRQYDVGHAAAMIHHADRMARGQPDPRGPLSRHGTRSYLALLGVLVAPFVVAAFAYQRAPRFFDALCSAELLIMDSLALWFLLYRFCWRRDLTLFRASVPRIAAGIIVGYLPIFFLDEVWALAARSVGIVASVSLLLAMATLLYIYIEVQRRLGDPDVAFSRARQIFVLGVLQAFSIGLVITGLIGPFMATRNWAEGVSDVEALREALPPLVGQLPEVVGIGPFLIFPAAVAFMTFLSFFIGTFLQLMWEDIPITEPL